MAMDEIEQLRREIEKLKNERLALQVNKARILKNYIREKEIVRILRKGVVVPHDNAQALAILKDIKLNQDGSYSQSRVRIARGTLNIIDCKFSVEEVGALLVLMNSSL